MIAESPFLPSGPRAGERPDYGRFYRRYRRCLWTEQGMIFATRSGAAFALTILLALAGEAARPLALFLLAASIAAAAFLAWRELRSRLELGRFCRALARESPAFADLFSAIELSRAGEREGVSPALRRALIDSVQENLDRESPERWIRIPRLAERTQAFGWMSLVLLSLFVLPPMLGVSGVNRLFFGSRFELARHLSVAPAGGRVVYGEPATVTVELLDQDRPAPKLLIRSSAGWETVPGTTEGRKTDFPIQAVTEPVRYKVRWRGLESETYLLTPVEPPRLTDFRVEIHEPAYTGLGTSVLESEPQVQVYRGARLEISARSTKPLAGIEAVTSLGSRLPVRLEDGEKVRVSVPVNNPFEFWFEMKGKDGMAPDRPVHYSVAVKEDASPQIRLLAPASDLIVGRETTLPFTYEIKDDLGVEAVFLRVEETGGGRRYRFPLKRYKPAPAEKIDTAEFDLGSFRTSPGQVLRMQLEAQDGDTVTGPKSGLSESILVQIQSYEKDHERVEQEMKAFRKDLLDLVAQQTLARVSDKDWKAAAVNPQALQQSIEESLRKQSEINAKAEQVSKRLEQTLNKMERDPLSDASLWSEQQALRDSLEFVRQNAMSRAREGFERKDWSKAVEEQDRAAAELERLSSLSDEMNKYGKMKDLVHSAEGVEEKAERINRDLAAGASDPRTMQALQDTLKDAMDLLSQIQRQVKDLPQELPDEFVNQASVKQLDLQAMNDSARKVADALKRGDAKSALQAAQELLKQVKQARETLTKASQGIDFSGGAAAAQQASEQEKTLQKIVERQEQVLQRTSELESKREQARTEAQKKALAALADRQLRAIQAAARLRDDLGRVDPPPRYALPARSSLSQALPTMEKVLKELREQNVFYSQKWLGEIIQQLAFAGQAVAADVPAEAPAPSTGTAQAADSRAAQTKSFLEQTGSLRSEEQAILDTLRNPPKEPDRPFSSQDQEELGRLNEEQSQLARETGKFHSELSKLADRSALVGPEILESIGASRKEMDSAAKSLSDQQTEPAQDHEQKALSHLRQGQDGLQQAMERMGQMKAGGSQPGFVQPRSAGAGGVFGFRQSPVRIPRAEDYLPPRQFREEILDSLKEKYPKAQEGVIRDYYKKLTE